MRSHSKGCVILEEKPSGSIVIGSVTIFLSSIPLTSNPIINYEHGFYTPENGLVIQNLPIIGTGKYSTYSTQAQCRLVFKKIS